MTNYTISEFLGIFLIALPIFVFATTILFRGIAWLFEYFNANLKENIFHHHYHYKALREPREPREPRN